MAPNQKSPIASVHYTVHKCPGRIREYYTDFKIISQKGELIFGARTNIALLSDESNIRPVAKQQFVNLGKGLGLLVAYHEYSLENPPRVVYDPQKEFNKAAKNKQNKKT